MKMLSHNRARPVLCFEDRGVAAVAVMGIMGNGGEPLAFGNDRV